MIAPDPLASVPPSMHWIIDRAIVDPDAVALVREADTPDSVIGTWLEKAHAISAIKLIAQALPIREAAWWAWVSARYATQLTGAPVPTAQVQTALAAIEQWIVRPDDASRRSVWEAGQAAGVDTPTGLVTAAIFLSGGSVGPPDAVHIPPPAGVSNTLVAAAIMSAAVSDPANIDHVAQAFVAQGIEIIKRLGGWEAALTAARQRYDAQLHEQARAKGTT
jgi:hypothetical protein